MATVTIKQGELKGGQSNTDSGFEYYEFLGIPYAKPPVGELRFKSPQPPESWTGTRDATKTDSNTIACQVDFFYGSVAGSEDCLYLNVYTRNLLTPNVKLKPVMVFFHGGGFVSGNGTLKAENGPDYLIENDVVIVTVNYRLGPLGFLCLDIPEAAGNMGLKDQVKALHWVQNNIDKFGGDKDNVTIFGVSAGSAACEFLLLSPLAKNLFHKAILQSGSSLNNWAINLEPKKMAINLAKEIGYDGPDDNTIAIYKTLLKAPALMLSGSALKVIENDPSKCIFFAFVPTIEKDFGNDDAFLKESPYTILKEGKYNKVPVIRGFCNKEGSLANMMKPIAVRELIERKSFNEFLGYSLKDYDITEYNSKLKTAYIDKVQRDDMTDFATDFFSDLNFAAGVCFAAKLQCNAVPVYMYKFSYDGKLNMFKALFGLMKKGAAHGDDIGYLLRHIGLASRIPDASDILIRNRITKMWTNFAKTGNPTPDTSDLEVQWPVFTEKTKEYLNIDKDITIESNYEPERIEIFESLYNKYE